jgi:hypothetical protein
MCIKINKVGNQEVGIWWGQKRFPWYGVPIWSLWPNIRFLPSIVAEKNATINEHICSMCIKITKVGKQEVGIWRVQKRYPQYGIPIWRLRPNIRFLSSTATEKNATKNILDGRTDRRTEVKQYTPSPFGERGYNKNKQLIRTISWRCKCSVRQRSGYQYKYITSESIHNKCSDNVNSTKMNIFK